MNPAAFAGIAVALAVTASAPAGTNRPAEADLYHHLTDALKNPPEQAGLPRVLLLGDSISIGYTVPVRKELQGKAAVFRPAVNCQHTGFGLENVKRWLGTNRWDVIHFNWGIWDTHLLDAKGALIHTADESKSTVPLHIRYTPEHYRTNLTALVKSLQGSGARLIWASSTPIMSRTGARFEDIRIRNDVAAEIMKENGIPVNDLYAFSLPHAAEWQTPDKVHFNAAGNEQLGRRVAASILEALKPAP